MTYRHATVTLTEREVLDAIKRYVRQAGHEPVAVRLDRPPFTSATVDVRPTCFDVCVQAEPS